MKSFPGGVRGVAALLTLLACAGLPLAHQLAPRDGWSWLAAEGRLADEGRDTARRFGYADLWQVSLSLDDPFAAGTRERIGRWEDELAQWPELSRVVGPSDARQLDDAPGGEAPYDERPRGADSAAGDAAIRARLRSRGDVRGWFFGRDEKVVRLYLASESGAPSADKITASARAAGLLGPSAPLSLEPLWPRPAVATLREDWRAALGAAAGIVVVGFVAAFFSALGHRRRSARRMIVAGLMSAAGLAAPFVVAPSPAWRLAGMCLALFGAIPFLLTLAVRGAVAGGRHLHLTVWWRALGMVSALLLLAAIVANGIHGRPWLQSREGATASVGFIALEADLEEPVVLGEMLRLTDFLRAQPAVAEAWSPADAFASARAGFAGHGTLPVDRAGVRRLWQLARGDGAVALGLSPAHDAALVAFRFRATATLVERAATNRDVAAYLAHDLRPDLLPLNVEDASLPPATRALGRGILAANAKERLTLLAASAGIALSRDQLLGLERVARQAAVVPTADPQKLAAAIAALFDEAPRAGKGTHLLARASSRDRLVRAVANQPWESGLAELRASLRAEAAHNEAEVEPLTAWLFPRVLAARFDAAAAMNLKALKDATGLPPSARGAPGDDLGRAMEAALVQGMGPVVGLPVGPSQRGAVRLHAWQADAAAGDKELAASWGFRIAAALAALVVGHGLLWFLVLGIDGLSFAAISFGPVALVLCLRAAAKGPVALPFILVLGASLAVGWALAIAWAPPLPRREQGAVHVP